MNQSQLNFNFSSTENQKKFDEDNFIFSSENAEAIDFLTKFFTKELFNYNSVLSCIIKGEEHSGKTHILNIFAKKFNAIFLNFQELQKQNIANFFSQNNFYILDNIDEIKNQELLLHIINSASEVGAFLVLSAKNIDNFTLKDLNSRLKNIATTEIKDPQSELRKILLAKGLCERQLKLEEDVIDFVAKMLNPSYKSLNLALEIIEGFCHANKKKFTLNEAKKML